MKNKLRKYLSKTLRKKLQYYSYKNSFRLKLNLFTFHFMFNKAIGTYSSFKLTASKVVKLL